MVVAESSRFLILVIDPGNVHCGVALIQCTEEEGFEKVKMINVLSPKDAVIYLKTRVKTLRRVICEEFRVKSSASFLAGSTLEVVETIGVIKHICRNNNCELIMQDPQNRIPFLKDEIVKQFRNEHVRDAVAHGLFHAYTYMNPDRSGA